MQKYVIINRYKSSTLLLLQLRGGEGGGGSRVTTTAALEGKSVPGGASKVPVECQVVKMKTISRLTDYGNQINGENG